MKKIKINEFILVKPVMSIKDLVSHPTKYVLTMDGDYADFINYIKNNHAQFIDDGILSIDGGVIIQINYQEITLIEQWDDLPTLWSYYLNVIEEYLENGEGEYYFPSQPIQIKLSSASKGKIRFSVDKRTIEFTSTHFFTSMIQQAETFFEMIVNDLGLLKYRSELLQIENIRNRMSSGI